VSVLVLLIVASLAIATAFLVAFIWAVRSGQFEDTGTPPLRMLGDDPGAPRSESHVPANQDSEHP
jgi:cbb3-type cytochrome oxidase maturation protein